jgi:PhoH-like ATPase
MKKRFILDTNVLLHDPKALYKFQDNDIYIPIVVVSEIDKFKRDQSEVGRNARTVSRYLDDERAKGSLADGVTMEGGGTLRVVFETKPVKIGSISDRHSQSMDDIILGVAQKLKEQNDEIVSILVTKDTNMRIKADALGIRAQDYYNDKISVDDLYTGYRHKEITEEEKRILREEGSLPVLPGFFVNQFIRLYEPGMSEEEGELLRVHADGRMRRVQQEQDVWGIRPRNLEQRLAIELLLDPEVKLVSLLGKAGTGKTLLALAAGLQMVVDENAYHRLMVGRPIHPLGKDLGYLPGDVDEKIRPWMQPIFDNLEYILHCNTEDGMKENITHNYFIDKGWMVVEPLTYMRGRSIPNQYMLVDEAQNLSPHEIKSIITRAGHGTKIVLTGDPQQIDNPYLDADTNGISYLVQRLKDQKLYGHIQLTKGERSELAECASNLL